MAYDTYAPQLPLEIENKSRFIMISDSLANAKQNLRMLVLTNPGEKLMNPEFGVGIYRYLFEPNSGVVTINNDETYSLGDFEDIISERIRSQVYRYSTNIQIDIVSITVTDSTLNIEIDYTYGQFTNDTLTLSLSS